MATKAKTEKKVEKKEVKKVAPVKKDIREEYQKGFPNLPGWYDCLLDGEEVRLRRRECVLRARKYWEREDGREVGKQHEVLWTGEPDIRP